MTELNTLKDLQIGTLHLVIGQVKLNDVVSHKMLKQEAIKDIKFLEKLPYSSNPKEDLDKVHEENMEETHFALFDATGAYDNSNVINYIKWKFNISEEDLKNG